MYTVAAEEEQLTMPSSDSKQQQLRFNYLLSAHSAISSFLSSPQARREATTGDLLQPDMSAAVHSAYSSILFKMMNCYDEPMADRLDGY